MQMVPCVHGTSSPSPLLAMGPTPLSADPKTPCPQAVPVPLVPLSPTAASSHPCPRRAISGSQHICVDSLLLTDSSHTPWKLLGLES